MQDTGTPWEDRPRATRTKAAAVRREELLLDALCDEPVRRAAARAELSAEAGGAPALHRLEERMEDARAELERLPGFDAAREERLIERVLAATTRAPRRRAPAGGWRWLWTGAAAGLLVGLGALALRERAPRGADVPLELAELALPAPIPATELAGVERIGPAVVLASARHELATSVAAARPPREVALDEGADAPLELRLLEARARGLRERRWDTWLKEVPLADLGTLSLALWCEVQLDRFVLCGERPPAWRKAVAILEQGLERRPEEGEGVRLLEHALERAREYGLTADRGEDVQVARLEAGALWTREWFEDLEAAGQEAGLAETGTWRAWVDWRGQ